MASGMSDVASWLGGIEIFLVLAVVIIGFTAMRWLTRIPSWVMAQMRRSRHRQQGTAVPKVGNLSSELKTVTDWHQLGINLGIETHELLRIECDHQGNERRKLEMLNLWLRRNQKASWGDVVSALKEMEENRVAENIRQNYLSEFFLG